MIKRTSLEMGRMSVEDYQTAQKLPFVVVLDNVRSQHNIGAVFRTADAMRIAGVYLCGICCCPPNAELHKTALGAEESVAWQYFQDTKEAVKRLQEQGYTCYAVEQAHNSITLEQAVAFIKADISNTGDTHPIAVVLGHEVFGVQQEVIDICGRCIEIPQYGTKHSMNVSVTAGIVMYRISEAMRG